MCIDPEWPQGIVEVEHHHLGKNPIVETGGGGVIFLMGRICAPGKSFWHREKKDEDEDERGTG